MSRRLTNEKFINRARKIHGNKYNYSKINYINKRIKINIICPKHGEFWQIPYKHLSGQGCPKCAKKHKYTTEEFIAQARLVHGDKYDYSKVNYVNNKTKICVICPCHGEFWQVPNSHLNGRGCPKCAKKHKYTTEEFIAQARLVHGDKYDYSKVNYVNNKTKICIICPDHGEFWQVPNSHLSGIGCPSCKLSHMERAVLNFLDKNNIIYVAQKRFDWLKSLKNRNMSLDFFLPDYNVAIECQGIQHYKARGIFTEEKVKQIKERDILKYNLCKNHNIIIYYIICHESITEKLESILQLFK